MKNLKRRDEKMDNKKLKAMRYFSEMIIKYCGKLISTISDLLKDNN